MNANSAKPRTTALKNIVKDSACQLGIRNTTLQVLFALLDCINSRTMEARIGRPKLMSRLGRCEKSIKNAMRDLRRIGIIYPVRYPRAAPQKTPVYKFRFTREAVEAFNERNFDRPFEPLAHGEYWCPAEPETETERGVKFTPRSEGAEDATRGKIFQNEGQNFPERGVNFTPPSKEVSKCSSDADTPSRREGDKLPERQPSARGDALTPIGKFDAVSILSRNGVNATPSQITAGMKTEELAFFGYQLA